MLAPSLALALALGQAPANEYPNVNLEVKGFTRDGRSLVYTGYFNDGSEGSPDEETVVVDLLTGQTQLLVEPATAKYLKAHPLDAAVASRASPDGKATAEVVIDPSSGDGTWSATGWTAAGSSSWQLSVTRAGKTTAAANTGLADTVTVWWSPDGHHTVWLSSLHSRGMRDPGSAEITLGTDGRPSVAVVMDKAQVKDGALKIAQTLSKAGFAVLKAGAAKQARDKSTVFASAGFEADAKVLAAAVPGGATVEKLTWNANTDLVVYAGPEAFK